jgi:hypothetical protein
MMAFIHPGNEQRIDRGVFGGVFGGSARSDAGSSVPAASKRLANEAAAAATPTQTDKPGPRQSMMELISPKKKRTGEEK